MHMLWYPFMGLVMRTCMKILLVACGHAHIVMISLSYLITSYHMDYFFISM